MHKADPEKLLHGAEFAYIVDTVCARMVRDQHTALDEADLEFIRLTAARMPNARLCQPLRGARRFRKHDRVICHIAGSRAWAAGTVIELEHAFDKFLSAGDLFDRRHLPAVRAAFTFAH